MAEQICDGIWLVGRYSPFQVGAWVFEHGGEGALLEMPPYQAGSPFAWDDCRNFVDEAGIEVKWLLLTHAHIDHTYGMPFYRRTFPDARLLAHRSFLDWYRRAAFDDLFYYEERELSLGGEPLYLLHAPKHSPQDCLVFFRGAVCTGDWTLGPVADCNPLVSPTQKLRTFERVREFLEKHDYHVHTAFSAHANEFRRHIDFRQLVDEMEQFWQGVPMKQWKRNFHSWQNNYVKAWHEQRRQKGNKGPNR